MTDQLLDTLVTDLKPVSDGAMVRRILGWLVPGMAVTTVLMLAWLGWRYDFPGAFLDPIFWIKFGYTSIFSVLALWAVERLARPGGSLRKPLTGVAMLVGALAVTGIAQLLIAGPDAARKLVLGGTALVCPFYIVALSVPILAVTLLVLRRLAPTNLPLAGLAAGLLSGATSAWVYAFHCGESGLPFVTIWYTTGIVVVALAGLLAGRFLLRWR